MERTTIIAGNWKMNLSPSEGERLINGLNEGFAIQPGLEVAVMPQTPMLSMVSQWLGTSGINLGAQNCSNSVSGALTGETSPSLLKNLGCGFCLAGHSERREIFSESNQLVAEKAKLLISLGITPIVCVGETLQERENNAHFDKISDQVNIIYSVTPKELWKNLVFAYEPIWAIGTGKTATPDQANEIHQFIRSSIKNNACENLAGSASILYGGSVKPDNAELLLQQSDIDGFLVGGASLKPEDFIKIINAYQRG